MREINNYDSQSGFVSLFTTLFFMLLITVITISFIQITTTEQQQALDNDLSSSALASAQSGIEDGKRAILKYYSLTSSSDKATYYSLMTSPGSDSCTSITGSQIGTDLGIASSGNVVNNSQINQSYSCLTVDLDSPDYLSQSSANVSQIIPLKAVGGEFQQIRVSWHLVSSTVGTDGDGIPSGYAAGPLLYPVIGSTNVSPGWSALGYPAYLRVQLFGYPNSGAYTRSDLAARSRTILLVPGQTGADANTAIDLAAADPNPGSFSSSSTGINPYTVKCEASPEDNLGSYACSALLQIPSGSTYASSANNYYLRITPIYGQTHFRVAMVNSSTEVSFDQVQPIIDATGRADDVYRRLQARVLVNPLTLYPEYALETANNICKNMSVSSETKDYVANNCP